MKKHQFAVVTETGDPDDPVIVTVGRYFSFAVAKRAYLATEAPSRGCKLLIDLRISQVIYPTKYGRFEGCE